jgi:hypothetical protein
MKPRIEYGRVAPEGMKAMRGLESYVRQCGLEASARSPGKQLVALT